MDNGVNKAVNVVGGWGRARVGHVQSQPRADWKSLSRAPWDGQRTQPSVLCALSFALTWMVPFHQPCTLDTGPCLDRERPLPHTWPFMTLQG